MTSQIKSRIEYLAPPGAYPSLRFDVTSLTCFNTI